MDDMPIILRALQSAFGLYGAIYVATAICAPRWFLDTIALEHIEWRYRDRQRARNIMSPGKPWYLFPAMFLTMIAVGVIVYAAAYAIVLVIPYDWGSPDEDGDWQSMRHYLQMMAAFLGGIGLVMRLEKNAEVLIWGPLERKARERISKAVWVSGLVSGDKRQAFVEKIKLEDEDTYPTPYEKDYLAGQRRAIERDILG